MPTPSFSAEFLTELRRLLAWRRDVRRFRPEPLPDGTLERLLEIACLAPSVGLSQPWRFVVVEDAGRRQAVLESFLACNQEALRAYPTERTGRYARLKLAGLQEAPHQVAVFCDEATDQGGGLGRRTMPEMLRYSAVLAVHTLWLAARAEGVGIGWVSILDPARVHEALQVPAPWSLVAYLCMGCPVAEDDVPELERAGWERRCPLKRFVLRR
jgi:5,6-dimethylbenzimidazole synthase